MSNITINLYINNRFNSKKIQMTQEKINNIDITINSPMEQQKQSPRFGVKPSKTQVYEALQNVGKHGKSHHQYMQVMAKHQPVKQMRKITMEQLSHHSKADSAWLSLNGIVYDVTTYLHYHPGGSIILKGCGRDCQALFYQYHPWVNAKHLLQKYAIGYASN